MNQFKIFLIYLVITILFINFSVVKADSINIIKDKNWNFSVVNSASGIMNSTDSSAFIADLSSIGSNEWDVKVSMDNISLEAGETYIYQTDITSDKR